MTINSAAELPLVLTPPQAADALGISQRKLWGMTVSGEIPFIWVGKVRRYPVSQLRNWIDNQQTGKDSQ